MAELTQLRAIPADAVHLVATDSNGLRYPALRLSDGTTVDLDLFLSGLPLRPVPAAHTLEKPE